MAGLVVSLSNLPADELSFGGSGANPGNLEVLLDNSGGTEDSTELQLYLVATDLGVGGVSAFNNVSLAFFTEDDPGIDLRIAPDNAGSPGAYIDGPLDFGDITVNGATPFWVKAVVNDNGSVETNRYSSTKLGINYVAVPT